MAEQILPIDRAPYSVFSLTTSWRAFWGAALNIDTGEFARTPSAGAAVRLLQVPWGAAAPQRDLNQERDKERLVLGQILYILGIPDTAWGGPLQVQDSCGQV